MLWDCQIIPVQCIVNLNKAFEYSLLLGFLVMSISVSPFCLNHVKVESSGLSSPGTEAEHDRLKALSSSIVRLSGVIVTLGFANTCNSAVSFIDNPPI